MLSRAWLAIIVLLGCGFLYAQADSLDAVVESDSTRFLFARARKAEIEDWLQVNRKNTSNPYLISRALQSDIGDIYNAGYLSIGRPNAAMPYRHGLEQLASAYSASLYHGYYNSFYNSNNTLGSVNYSVASYPFEPTLSMIHGGIGEQQHRFARVMLKKGTLLGFRGAEYQGDMLVQNGIWTDINSAETSMKHYVCAEHGLLKFEAEYASWAKDVAMSELMPIYWQANNYKLAHDQKHQYAAIKLPYAELKVLSSKETATHNSFARKLENESTQLNLSYLYDAGTYNASLAYERAWTKSNFDIPLSFDREYYKDKLSASWDCYPGALLSVKADLLDWKRSRLFSDLAIPYKGHLFGVYANARIDSDSTALMVNSIYSGAAALDVMDISIRNEVAGYLRYEYQGVSSLLAVGAKKVRQRALANLNISDEQFFVRLAFDIKQSWRSWELETRPYWIWTKADASMCESPEFTFQGVQNIYYHLPYNNSLVAGFGLSGHSGYYTANTANPVLIEASTVLDMWAGFNIDRYFELRVKMLNALESSVYGAFPAPRSLHVELRWFYLN